MKIYSVKFIGITPLLMHNLDINWIDAMKLWISNPENKKNSVAGDDRSPAWKWIGYLYVENKKIVMPADNLMSCLRDGAKKVPNPKGRGSLKSISQSGIIVDQSSWDLIVDKKAIPSEPFQNLIGINNFEEHKKKALENGFFLFCKHASVNRAKTLRVRPRFDSWEVSGTITILDDLITEEVLGQILLQSGTYCGLCDWRPGSPMSPGPYGKFTSEYKLIKET